MARRTRLIARPWPLAIAVSYAVGIWLGTWAWAASVQLVVATAQLRKLGLPAPGWVPWLALLLAAAGAVGFILGWRLVGPRSRVVAPARACVTAWAAGCLFPWLNGVLLPALAALRGGIWPLLAWCMLGSALLALAVARLLPKTSLKGCP